MRQEPLPEPKTEPIKPLSNPSSEEIVALALTLSRLYPNVQGWKFGAANYKDKRRFDPAHYNHQWFNKKGSVILAVDLTCNQTVQRLEQSVIDLASSVNHNKSGLPCEYTVNFPALIYAVPLLEGLSQRQFWTTRAWARVTNPPPPPSPLPNQPTNPPPPHAWQTSPSTRCGDSSAWARLKRDRSA